MGAIGKMASNKQKASSTSPSVPEVPKVALNKNISLKFYLHLSGHVLSLLITGAILQLTFRNVYRSDDSPWDYRWYTFNLGRSEEGNLLQLVAKVHELIMVASLYGIVLHIIRRLLISTGGLPLGLLVGGYQPPGSYVVHTALWSPLLGSFRSGLWRFAILALGLLFTTVFTNTLGPASAIALIPNLDWHPMEDPFLNIKPQTATYHRGRENSTAEETMRAFYPPVLDHFAFNDTSHFNSCLVGMDHYTSDDCPGSDFDAIFSWMNTFTVFGSNTKVPAVVGHNRYIKANSLAATALLPDANTGGVAIGTSLPFFVVELMDQLWSLVSLKGMRAVEPERQRLRISPESPVLAPVVKVQCQAYDFESAKANNATLFFPTSWLYDNTTQAGVDQAWPIPQNIWDVERKMYDMRYSWLPVPQDDRHLDQRASTGVVFKLPSSSGYGFIMPCVIAAHWRRPEIIMDPTVNLRAEYDFIEPGALESLGKLRSLGPVVRIERDWADLGFFKPLKQDNGNGPYSMAEVPTNQLSLFIQTLWAAPEQDMNMNGSAISYCDSGAHQERPWPGNLTVCDPISMMLSLAFARSMATVGNRAVNNGVVLRSSHATNLTTLEILTATHGIMDNGIFNTTMVKNLPHPLNITFEVERFGWGYGFQSSGNGTLIYAFSVLLLHSALVIAYLVYLVWFWRSKEGYLSSAWDDLADLLALALVSTKVKALGDVGAGIECPSTWNKRVMVRPEVDGGDKLDLVVKESVGGGGMRPELDVGKKYR